MARQRTIKGPAKKGTITRSQARAAAREVLEERYGKKEDVIGSAGPTKQSAKDTKNKGSKS